MKRPNLAPPVLHKYAYELRYQFGFGYLDRCGDVTNAILRENAGWMVAGGITPAGAQLRHREKGMVFAFDNLHLVLGQDQSDKVKDLVEADEFASVAAKLTTTAIDRIEPDLLTRVGFRVWRLYGTKTRQEAQETVKGLGFVRLQSLCVGEGTSEIEDVAFNGTLVLPDRLLRFAVAAVEQNIEIDPATELAAKARIRDKDSRLRRAAAVDQLKAKSAIAAFPQHAVLVDTDYYVEDPPIPADLEVTGFITSASEMSERFATQLLKGVPDEAR